KPCGKIGRWFGELVFKVVNRLSGLYVPDRYRPVARSSRGKHGPIQAIRQATNQGATTPYLTGFLTQGRSPELHLSACRRQPTAVRTEGQTKNLAGMTLERQEVLARRCVGDPNRLVRTGRG